MTISVEALEDMLDIVHGFLRRGINFNVRYGEDEWVIELTGGF
jgi:hypothetical protein